MTVERERRHQKYRQMIMIKYAGICHICKEPYSDAIDHVVPVAKGGSDHPANLRPAHTSCNSRKGGSNYPSWADSNPNMWLPGHLPAELKKQQERERQQKLAEKRRLLKIAQHQYDKDIAMWNKKQVTIKSLRLNAPVRPLPEDPAAFAAILATVGAVFVAVLYLTEDEELISALIVAALLGFLGWWIFYVATIFLYGAFTLLAEATFMKHQYREYWSSHRAWAQLLKHWEAQPPSEQPKPPQK